jgi:NAD(P)-dependent dehydrogenase (short-subunit alcohol dehydrogenase family)
VVARDAARAAPVMKRLRAHGADVRFFRCDLAEGADARRLVAAVLRRYGGVDILVNNAGRSIRRSIAASFDRFHDFERTMQLNYFGGLRLILGFLPAMVRAGGGHVVNVSSIGVLTRVPRFSAYVASKAALDAFSECAASEFADRGVRFTTIHMPLVRTPRPRRSTSACPCSPPTRRPTSWCRRSSSARRASRRASASWARCCAAWRRAPRS